MESSGVGASLSSMLPDPDVGPRSGVAGVAVAVDVADVDPDVDVDADWDWDWRWCWCCDCEFPRLRTSRLLRTLVLRPPALGLPTFIGNRPFSGPLDRSRACLRAVAGLLSRARFTIARCRASVAARRLLSSVLMVRGRPLVARPCVALD